MAEMQNSSWANKSMELWAFPLSESESISRPKDSKRGLLMSAQFLSLHGSNELKLLRSISVSESSILIKYCDTSANLASKFGDMTTYLL